MEAKSVRIFVGQELAPYTPPQPFPQLLLLAKHLFDQEELITS
jgi:hypothetical protein